jgi:hypothetical protein
LLKRKEDAVRGDFTRLTFRRRKHYSDVLHQQGRVWLDSDWNEQVFDRLDLLEQETIDVIGRCGVPDDPGTAFLIEPKPNDATDFIIHGGAESAGRAYVDGILCRLDADTTYLTQHDFLDPPPITLPAQNDARAIIYLEVWRRLITYLEDRDIREIALNGPDTATRLRTIAQIKVQVVPDPDPDDDDAVTPTCDNALDFLPGIGQGVLTTLQPADTQPEDPCRLPDPALFTGRENHFFRVEIHDGGGVSGVDQPDGGDLKFSLNLAADAAKGAVTLKLATAPSAAQVANLTQSGVARIADLTGQAETLAIASVTGDTIALARGLTFPYKTAQQAAVSGGVARFKWSRDNAAFAVRVTDVAANRLTLTVDTLGRDQVTTLRQGDLIEISDDASELGPARGHLTFLTADPDPDLFTVNLADPLPARFDVAEREARHLLLRRWDGFGWAAGTFDEVTTPDMDLGDGVHIEFGGFDLRPGDWWNFATRVSDGSVERLDQAPPLGIERHRCPLAIARWEGKRRFTLEEVLALAEQAAFTPDERQRLQERLQNAGDPPYEIPVILTAAQAADVSQQKIASLQTLLQEAGAQRTLAIQEDCRQLFPPLTDLPTGGGHKPYLVLKALGGDGQEGPPLTDLPCRLRAGVENELGLPAAGVRLRLTAQGGGTLSDPVIGASGASIDLTTGADGVVQAIWALGQGERCEQVITDFIVAPPQGAHLPVRFTAQAVRQPDFPRVDEIKWRHDRPLDLPSFNGGALTVVFTEQMHPATATLDTFVVVVELPDHAFRGEGYPGHRLFILLGEIIAEGTSWTFLPRPELSDDELGLWLAEERRVLEEAGLPNERPLIRCRVTLKGNVILDEGGKRQLDGDVFGQLSEEETDPITGLNLTDLIFPSGDGVRGGDFESWFYLGD